MNEYTSQYVAQLKAMKWQEPPVPWKRFSRAVGGLRHVGYAHDSDQLLVMSTGGRGVFDCLTGERVARLASNDPVDWDPDSKYLLARGIGPIDGISIRVAGIWGGGLPIHSQDNWDLELVSPDWPHSFVMLQQMQYEGHDNFKDPFWLHGAMWVSPPDYEDDIIAYGFSETGRSFVVAMSHTLEIFSREL